MPSNTYAFYDVLRSCGHRDTKVTTKTKFGWESTVKKWAEDEKCFACQKTEDDVRKTSEESYRVKADQYMKDHNIGNEGHVTAYDDSADIIIHIK